MGINMKKNRRRHRRYRKHNKNKKIKRWAKTIFMWIGICVVAYFLITSFTNIRINNITSIESDPLERNCSREFSERINVIENQYGFDFKIIEKRRIENQVELNNFYNLYKGAQDKNRNFPLYAFSISMGVTGEGMRLPAIIICDNRGLTPESIKILS